MTQFIEPNKKSDLVAPRVFDWLKCLRTGLLEGFTVTPGSSGLLITIASGRVVIGGTTIYDDLTRNDATLISSAPGTGNRHFLVYAKYTYVDTFPPAAMEIRVVMNSAVAPLKPTAPALPVNGVKLADIFLPEGDTDWTDALFVNAPKMPDRGQADGDVLIERLIASNANVICAGGGSIIYDGGGNITWTQDIKFFALTTTHQEKYFSVPLAVGQILVGASPLTGVTDNCIVFTVLDRTAVGDPAAPGNLPLYVLDINAPGSGAWDIFFDPANRDDIFWLAMVIDGELVTRAGVGNALPPPDVDGRKFLRNDPGGDHYWSLITEDLVVSILSIASFGPTTPAVEVGVTVTNPSFAATYNLGPPITLALLKDSSPGPGTYESPPPSPPGATFSATGIWQKLNTNEFVRFQLAADAGDTPDTALVDIAWQRFFYYGKGTSVVADEAGIKSLDAAPPGGRALAPGCAYTFVMTGLSSEYAYFAYPTSAGALTGLHDNVAGFDIDFTLVGTATAVATENGAGTTTNYYLYRTTYLQTGIVNLTTR